MCVDNRKPVQFYNVCWNSNEHHFEITFDFSDGTKEVLQIENPLEFQAVQSLLREQPLPWWDTNSKTLSSKNLPIFNDDV